MFCTDIQAPQAQGVQSLWRSAQPGFLQRIATAALVSVLASLAVAASAQAQTAPPTAAALQQAQPQALPAQVDALLARAKVPREALSAIVMEAAPGAAGRPSAALPLLSYQAGTYMNPASVMKLVTTYAGLELLGPSYTWNTPVYIDGSISNGVLQGNLVIQGKGDPTLVMERLWLLMRRIKALGITTISGDILLDRSAFATSTLNPADFDGEPLRAYNATPDALLVNFKSISMSFSPNPGSGLAAVSLDPPLANVQMQATVPLTAGASGGTTGALADCGDYRAALKPDFSDPFRISFAGSYPVACGEKVWTMAYADPASYAERAVLGMWQDIGGKLGGRVRQGRAPAGQKPAFEVVSPTLAEVIRDINKYSNNVMAQQLFMTLSLNAGNLAQTLPRAASADGVASPEASREIVNLWWRDRFGEDPPVLENGSGLSRTERITARGLARMLQAAYMSGAMPELMASMPISGIDGTLKRNRSSVSQGWAHLKTGTLRDATAMAGYVDTPTGKRLIVVAMVNHANAPAARPALEALVDWAVKEGAR